MKKFKATIKSFIPVIDDCIKAEDYELIKEFDHDVDLMTVNQIMYEDIITRILEIVNIDWDIEEVD